MRKLAGSWSSTQSRKPKKKGVKTPIEPEDQLAKLGARIKTLRIKAGYASYEPRL